VVAVLVDLLPPGGWNRPVFDRPDDPRFVDALAFGGLPLPGDVLIAPRVGYGHYGIYLGDAHVAHYVKTGRVTMQITSMDEFIGPRRWYKVVLYRAAECFDPDEVVRRVLGTLGWGSYHFFVNNCEHWAHWCKTGRCECEQTGMSSVVRQKVKYRWENVAVDAAAPVRYDTSLDQTSSYVRVR
jgi:hypothetical protein